MDIIERLRTVKVSESRHVGFAYEAWAQEASEEIEILRGLLTQAHDALRPFAEAYRGGQDDDGMCDQAPLAAYVRAAELVPE